MPWRGGSVTNGPTLFSSSHSPMKVKVLGPLVTGNRLSSLVNLSLVTLQRRNQFGREATVQFVQATVKGLTTVQGTV